MKNTSISGMRVEKRRRTNISKALSFSAACQW
jgi:hypothetical protein